MKFIKRLFFLVMTAVLTVGAVWGSYRLFPLRYLHQIRTYSDEMGLDRYLVAALIKAESNFRVDAVSNAGAKGLMQLTDETAKFCAGKLGMNFSEADIFSPDINIRLGTYYLKRTLDMFNGSESLAIAAYNAGEGNVKKWLGDPTLSTDGESLHTIPYEETKRHVKKIEIYTKIYRLLYPNI